MTDRLKSAAGYSLVEVMAAIVILTVAIIPMVTMFDTGLRSATTSGNYDKARALANTKLEEAKSRPYDTAAPTNDDIKNDFPVASSTPSAGGTYTSSNLPAPASAGLPAGSTYRIEKRYIEQPPTDPGAASETFTGSSSDEGLMRITTTVTWGAGNSYNTSGLVG